MKKTNLFKKALLLALISALIATVALGMTGCNKTPSNGSSDSAVTQTQEIGTGSTQFKFSVVGTDGKTISYTVNTDKKTVGEALIENKLISGEDGPYGLYVKTVNGETLDYEKDGYYWSFYINGEYGMTGVDKTDITANAEYAFKAEKG